MPAGRACPSCGAAAKATTRFCGNCGAAIAPSKAGDLLAGAQVAGRICPACASSIGPRAQFCGACGQPLGGENGEGAMGDLR
ncbi:MAG: double zinc ribbon domain-containing protein [Chloroflexota bacterium]